MVIGPKMLIPSSVLPANAFTNTVSCFPSTHALFSTKVNPIPDALPRDFDIPPDVKLYSPVHFTRPLGSALVMGFCPAYAYVE
jgi:hypothetical protein